MQQRKKPAGTAKIEALLAEAQTLQKEGKLQEAYAVYGKILEIEPQNVRAFYSAGMLLGQTDNRHAAAELLRRALTLEPDFLPARSALLALLFTQGNYKEAEAECRKILASQPDNREALYTLGLTLLNSNRTAEAESELRQLVKIAPDSHDSWHALGVVLETLGKLDDARAAYEKAIKHNAQDSAAFSYQKLGELGEYRDGDQRIAAMQKLLARPSLSAAASASLHFALGNAYHQLKAYDKAFHHYREGNILQRATYGDWNMEVARQEFHNMRKTFAQLLPAANLSLGYNDDTPIFILGMPRSGTTLVEQILASHPEVFGADETKHLAHTIQFGASRNKEHSFNASELTQEERKQYGAHYVELLRKDAPAAARHITDKMPNNFMYIGIIALLLPKARIIHCLRDPMDTCFSIFRQQFSEVHQYASDLKELGEYYRMYRDLMDFWHTLLPGRMHDVRYETLVNNFEPEVRGLLKHCGLSWDKKCLEFHTSTRDVKTASNAQVRKPLYRSSVALWKPYAPYLDPLKEALGPYAAQYI